jgi:hypothetical protein
MMHRPYRFLPSSRASTTTLFVHDITLPALRANGEMNPGSSDVDDRRLIVRPKLPECAERWTAESNTVAMMNGEISSQLSCGRD